MDRNEEHTSPDRVGQDEEPESRPRAAANPTWGERLVHEHAASHRIALYDLGAGDSYCGLIVPAPSGYLWRQQTSGMLCAQRDLEGIYLPIPDHGLGQNLESLHVGCCMDTRDDWEAGEAYRAAHPEEVAASEAWTREHMPELAAVQDALGSADRPHGITVEEADQLDDLLRVARLPLSVARDRLDRSTEVWVWARVADNVGEWEHEYAKTLTPRSYRFQWMFAALAGTEAVLTWQNCD